MASLAIVLTIQYPLVPVCARRTRTRSQARAHTHTHARTHTHTHTHTLTHSLTFEEAFPTFAAVERHNVYAKRRKYAPTKHICQAHQAFPACAGQRIFALVRHHGHLPPRRYYIFFVFYFLFLFFFAHSPWYGITVISPLAGLFVHGRTHNHSLIHTQTHTRIHTQTHAYTTGCVCVLCASYTN